MPHFGGVPSASQSLKAKGFSISPFTIAGSTAQGGDLRIFPDGAQPPVVSTINYRLGQVRANNAVVLLGPSHGITIQV